MDLVSCSFNQIKEILCFNCVNVGELLYQFDFEDYLRWKHKKWELKGEETSMKKEVMIDMTSGRIAPQILKFAMPVLLGLIFQRIYNFADSYIVGHFLGDNALAAVSVAGVACI